MTAEQTLPSPDQLPPVITDHDLLDRWKLLMGPRGFGLQSLWLLWFDDDGRQLPVVMPVDDMPDSPNRELLDHLLPLLGVAHDTLRAGWLSMAFGRPGPGLITGGDRAWARALDVPTLARIGIPARPLFLATESRVRQLVLDEL